MKYILRGLVKSPLFTLTALASLALGIGANTAIFSLLDQVLLRTLPVVRPEELVFFYHPGPLQGSVWSDEPNQPAFSYPVFREFERQQQVFTGIASTGSVSASISFRNQERGGAVHVVSGSYFETLGVRPAMGRVLSSEDDRNHGGHPVAVLSHTYWTSRFGADPAVLNQTLAVNGFPLTIVGVTQKGFAGVKFGDSAAVFVPIAMRREVLPGWDGYSDRKDYWLPIFGRLKPGVSREQAQAAMNILYKSQLEQDEKLLDRPRPEFLERFRTKTLVLAPGAHGRGSIRNQGRLPLIMLMAMTLMVLLIACANVANLLLARAAGKTRETAVRLAMGASRPQLIRHLLTEACVLSAAGGALGLAVAWATIRGVVSFLPTWTGTAGFLEPSLDPRVLIYSLMLSVVTGLAFGLFPALHASKATVSLSLKDQAGQTTSTGAANFFRKSLVTAQVAVSLLLLISAGMFAQSMLNLSRVDLGVRVDNLVTFSLDPKLNRYSDERAARLYEQLETRLSGLPGVMAMSAARLPVLTGDVWNVRIRVEGYTAQGENLPSASYNEIGAGYFAAVGTPLVSGREFNGADNLASRRVAIVNESFARQFLADRNPLGARLGFGKTDDVEIVGVVKDAKYSSLQDNSPRVFYVPYRQVKNQGLLHFYVRTPMDPDQASAMIRRELAALDASLPLRELKTMQTQIEEQLFADRLLVRLTALFGGLATLLAAMGLYGVLAFNVARRTREIGIRMALGANPGRVRWLVLREMASMVGIGTAIGLAAAAGSGRLIRSMLFGVEAWDPAVSLVCTAGLAAVALMAAFVPARRATSVDPMVALRHE